MQSSAAPSRISVPFANSGGKTTIPVASQIGITPGAASFTDGFPPLTRTPLAGGGVPPSGLDMNGVLYAASVIQQWQSAGGLFKYDSTFSTAVGGYPKGSVLLKSSGTGIWQSTAENNTTDPDAGGAGWVSVIGNFNGTVFISAVTTLTAQQSGSFISVSNSGYTVTLPNPSTPNLTYDIYNAGVSSNVTISTPGGVIFSGGNGATTYSLTTSNSIKLVSDGTNWIVISGAGIAVKSVNGYHKAPNGVITQWGTSTTSAGGTFSQSLPVAFPNAAFSITATAVTVGLSAVAISGNVTTTAANIFAANSTNGTGIVVQVYWVAIGN